MASPDTQNPTPSRSRMIMEEIFNAVQVTPISQQATVGLQSDEDSPRDRDVSPPLPYASSSSNDLDRRSTSSPLGPMLRSTPPTLTFTNAASLKVVVPHDDVPTLEPNIKADAQQQPREGRHEEQQRQDVPVVDQDSQHETASPGQQQLQQTQPPNVTPSSQITKEPESQLSKTPRPRLFSRPPPPVVPQAFKFAPRKLSQTKLPQAPLPVSTQIPSSANPSGESTHREVFDTASNAGKTNPTAGVALPSNFPVRGAQPIPLSAVKATAASTNPGMPTIDDLAVSSGNPKTNAIVQTSDHQHLVRQEQVQNITLDANIRELNGLASQSGANGITSNEQYKIAQSPSEKCTEIIPIQNSLPLIKEEPNDHSPLDIPLVCVREVYAKVRGAGAQPQLVLEIADDDDDNEMENTDNTGRGPNPNDTVDSKRTATTEWSREMEIDQQPILNKGVVPFVPVNTLPPQHQQLSPVEKLQIQALGNSNNNSPNVQFVQRTSTQATPDQSLLTTNPSPNPGRDDISARQIIQDNSQADRLQSLLPALKAITTDSAQNNLNQPIQSGALHISAGRGTPTSPRQSAPSGEQSLFDSLLLHLCKDGQYDLVSVVSNFAQKEKSYKVEIEQSNNLMKAYEQQLEQAETAKTTHKAAVEELNKELSTLRNDAQVMLTEKAGYEAKIDSLKDDCQNLRKHCDDLRERLKNESTKGHSDSIQLAEMRDQLSNLCHLVETQASVIASEYEPYKKLAEGSLSGKKDLDQKLTKNAQILDKISLTLQGINATVEEEGGKRALFQEELMNSTKLQTAVDHLEKQLEEKSALVLQERAERESLLLQAKENTPLLDNISRLMESLKEPQDGASASLKELLTQQQALVSTLDKQYPNLVEQISSLKVDQPITVSHVASLERSVKDSQDNICDSLSRLNAVSLKEDALSKIHELIQSEMEKLLTTNKQGYESIEHSLGQSITTLQSNVLSGETRIKSLQDELLVSTQELNEKSAHISSLEKDLQFTKLEIEHKNKQLEEVQVQLNRLQELKEELATVKGELHATKERVKDAEKRAEEANKKASECTANHLSLQQTKILLDNLETRHEHLRKEKEALEEKNRRDEECKQTRHEAEVEFTRKQLKDAHADELQSLKRRIETLESQLEVSKTEVQNANEFNKSANDRLAEIMNKHSDEMIKWENEKADLLAKVKGPANNRYGAMGRYSAVHPQEQNTRRHDVYSPFKIPSSTTRRALFHPDSPVPQLAANLLPTIHDESPLFAKSQQAIQRQSTNSESSTRGSVSDPVTPVNNVEKEANESVDRPSPSFDSVVSRNTNLEQQRHGPKFIPSFFENLKVTEEIRLTQVEVPTRFVGSTFGKENSRVNAGLDDDDILNDSDESNLTMEADNEQEGAYKVTKDSETPEELRGVKRPINFGESEVRSSSPLPPKRCKAVPKPKEKDEDETIGELTESSSQPQSYEEIEQPKIQSMATRRSTCLSHRARMTPIAEATNSSSDDGIASRVRPKTAHGKTGRPNGSAQNPKLRSTSGPPNKRHRRTYSQ